MSDKERDSLVDKPYILCPELSTLGGIVVTPLWFITEEKGVPILLLSNVPDQFSSLLDSNRFVKSQDGWLIDVSTVGESFWISIFGNITFSKKKPVEQYRPKAIQFAPLTQELMAIVRAYSMERLGEILQDAGVVGDEHISRSQKNAARGAVSCQGAWDIIRAAVRDRLDTHPEDVSAFEYAWSTLAKYDLSDLGLPKTIETNRILKKIIDRQRIHPQMETVLPTYFYLGVARMIAAKVDWRGCRLFYGSLTFGPISTEPFEAVHVLARHLIDNDAEPIDDHIACEAFKNRISPELLKDRPMDWVDEVVIPDMDQVDEEVEDFALSQTDENHVIRTRAKPVPVDAKTRTELDSLRFVTQGEVYRRLGEVYSTATKRVSYTRAFCVDLVNIILFVDTSKVFNRSFLNDIERLIAIFAGVVNEESLEAIWGCHQSALNELYSSLSRGSIKRQAQLFECIGNRDSAQEKMESSCFYSQSECQLWWWRGFACERIGLDWYLYCVKNKQLRQVDGLMFSSREALETFLHGKRRAERVRSIRERLGATYWQHGFEVHKGLLMRLSDSGFSSQEMAAKGVDSSLEAAINNEFALSLIDEPEYSLEEINGYLENLLSQVFPGEHRKHLLTMGGQLRFECKDYNTELFYCDEPILVFGPGQLLIAWSNAFYRYVEECYPALIDRVCEVLYWDLTRPDIDLSYEDDALDMLDHNKSCIVKSMGVVAFESLKDAIESPSPESVEVCESLYQAADYHGDADVLDCIRNVLLLSAQYAERRTASHLYQEKCRTSLTERGVFVRAVAQFVGLQLYWRGHYEPRLGGAFFPGDDPTGDLYPAGESIFKVGSIISTWSDSLSDKSLANEKEPHTSEPSAQMGLQL